MLHKIDRVLAPVTWLVAVFAVAVLLIGPELVGAEKPPPTPEQAATTAASGKDVFTTNCGSCHTLADAGTTGTIGPNLDDAAPDAATVKAYVRGGAGSMPAFGDSLSNAEIDAVAAYVSSVAGG
ncbi:MAG TPA: cytochrome c [Solirubrobacteraceae bacterium]|nr:cytochrome c [Solirubrobacteraceae bacterium]